MRGSLSLIGNGPVIYPSSSALLHDVVIRKTNSRTDIVTVIVIAIGIFMGIGTTYLLIAENLNGHRSSLCLCLYPL